MPLLKFLLSVSMLLATQAMLVSGYFCIADPQGIAVSFGLELLMAWYVTMAIGRCDEGWKDGRGEWDFRVINSTEGWLKRLPTQIGVVISLRDMWHLPGGYYRGCNVYSDTYARCPMSATPMET